MLFEKIQLEEDEKIISIIHKHWFVVFSHSIGILFLASIPLAGWVLIGSLLQHNTATLDIELSDYFNYFMFFYSLWLLINWMIFAQMWTTYHLDIWVITDRRVIVIDQVSLFRRKIGSFRLERLQDVNIEINGIIATFLNYGSVECETASGSHTAAFKTKNLPDPRHIKSIILKAADVRLKKQSPIAQDVG